jgi:hypothetical protein
MPKKSNKPACPNGSSMKPPAKSGEVASAEVEVKTGDVPVPTTNPAEVQNSVPAAPYPVGGWD